MDVNARVVCFAGSAVAIEYEGARPARIVDLLCRYTPSAFHPSPHFIFRLIADPSGGELRLYHGDALLWRGVSDGALAEYLLGEISYHLADKSHGGLLFHAAGLSWGGRGLVLPGQTGAGKSTLAAWLLTRGFRYLTDELVYVPDGASHFCALTRPLNLKRAARPVLCALLDWEEDVDRIWSSMNADLVPPELLSDWPPHGECGLNLVVFPRYRKDGAFELHPLSRAQAGLEWMKCLVNARNLPGHGFSEVARQAQAVPAFRLAYGRFAQLGRAIEDLLSGT